MLETWIGPADDLLASERPRRAMICKTHSSTPPSRTVRNPGDSSLWGCLLLKLAAPLLPVTNRRGKVVPQVPRRRRGAPRPINRFVFRVALGICTENSVSVQSGRSLKINDEKRDVV